MYTAHTLPSQYADLLQVVSYQKANKDELYTLSTEGVNQYRNNVHTEFTPLDQWQREVSLFTSLKQLKTFQIYKLWKGFRQAPYSANAHPNSINGLRCFNSAYKLSLRCMASGLLHKRCFAKCDAIIRHFCIQLFESIYCT